MVWCVYHLSSRDSSGNAVGTATCGHIFDHWWRPSPKSDLRLTETWSESPTAVMGPSRFKLLTSIRVGRPGVLAAHSVLQTQSAHHTATLSHFKQILSKIHWVSKLHPEMSKLHCQASKLKPRSKCQGQTAKAKLPRSAFIDS